MLSSGLIFFLIHYNSIQNKQLIFGKEGKWETKNGCTFPFLQRSAVNITFLRKTILTLIPLFYLLSRTKT